MAEDKKEKHECKNCKSCVYLWAMEPSQLISCRLKAIDKPKEIVYDDVD